MHMLDKTHSSRYLAQAKQLHKLRKPSSYFSLSFFQSIKYQNCLIHNLKVKYFQNIKLEDFMQKNIKEIILFKTTFQLNANTKIVLNKRYKDSP